ncbi:MAG: PCRF domain-containing protein, partial [Bacteroidales bacterium]|nr:PCRF domain-containing protein [Bacteroidales bacterium]
MSQNMLLDKLEGIKIRFDEIAQQITDPDIMSDMKKYIKLNKEYKELEPLIDAYHKYNNIIGNIKSSKELLVEEDDEEMREMAQEELEQLNEQLPQMEEEIRLLLIPKDPEDSKNAIVEIRAGTGGDEASIFAGDLSRMYLKFCESKGWKTSISHISEGTSGGYKEIVFSVEGNNVYGILKYESGVHRVQRVPQTETQGRV